MTRRSYGSGSLFVRSDAAGQETWYGKWLPPPAAGEGAPALMLTVGVDLSASERNTALAEVEWAEGRARVSEPSLGLADPELLELLTHAESTGIDAPFGWPEPMVAALHSYSLEGRWPEPDKRAFRYRRADAWVHDRARAAALGLTEPPPAEARELARVEGWVHLPHKGGLGELASGGGDLEPQVEASGGV